VFDRYGSREVSVIASECERHEGMHINADNLFLEFSRDGRNVASGETGEILITDLRNYRMPRSATGSAIWSAVDKVCECGRGLP
jgi:phenylacetate-CoA ligase